MVSDFFYPNMGGVEMHIWSLSQCLIQRGHKVIVITHAYGDRQGIRYMTNGLKVYYLPLTVCYDQVIFPTLFSFFALFRNILIREKIHIVHGHQSTSSLTNECIFYARTLGYKVCYTDHSLFGFDDTASIHINKILKATLSDIDSAICVSNTCRENLVLRASLHPASIYTIPNAVDASKFTPDPSRRYPIHTINIVLLSRLVYRKGIDLLVKVIPIICRRFPNAHFIIGGDGPKKLMLEEMRELYQLHEVNIYYYLFMFPRCFFSSLLHAYLFSISICFQRVELLGGIPHHQVRDSLVRGHIFLNCSLTESFCIALLEAASCGLFVVSTKVGGVPEVLPPSMITFAEPTVRDLVDALAEAISISRRVIPSELHERMKIMYSWYDVALRTELVYQNIMNSPVPSFAIRILRYMSVGPWLGVLLLLVISCLHSMRIRCDLVWPRDSIDICPDFPWMTPTSHVKSSSGHLSKKKAPT